MTVPVPIDSGPVNPLDAIQYFFTGNFFDLPAWCISVPAILVIFSIFSKEKE
jgi:hypothetical protein